MEYDPISPLWQQRYLNACGSDAVSLWIEAPL